MIPPAFDKLCSIILSRPLCETLQTIKPLTAHRASHRSATLQPWKRQLEPRPYGTSAWSGCCPRSAGRWGASTPESHAAATARPSSGGSARPHCAGGCELLTSGARSRETPGQSRRARCQPAGAAAPSPGQLDNEIPRTVERGPVGEQAGQVRVKCHGPAPAALAAADQQGAGREVDIPPLQGHGLADTQPGPPHDERRHPGAAKPQGRQGVQKPLDLLGIPVMRNCRMGTFTSKVPIRAIRPRSPCYGANPGPRGRSRPTALKWDLSGSKFR